jgi:hypothetical protein
MKHQTSLGDRSNVLAATRTTLEQVDRDIRSANPLCFASGQEIAMFEDSPTARIVDYSVITTNGVTKLIYRQYGLTSTPNSGPSCVVTDNFSTAAKPTTYYELTTTPPVTRTALTNLTGATSSVFTTPSTATFNTCAAGGSAPSDTTTLTAGAIKVLTVNVSVKPPTLSSAVTTSDCGTYLRNLYVPPT